MKRILTALAVVTFVAILGGPGDVQALTIQGPTFDNSSDGWVNSGLSITALQDVYLTSFVYQNNGVADVVYLENSSLQRIFSVTSPAADTSHLINVSWFMQAGQTYHLLAENPVAFQSEEYSYSNGKFAFCINTFPTANAEIRVDGTWGNGGLHTDFWFFFNDITTSTSPVPLPPGALLLGSGLLGLIGIRRFRK